jgi:hypothetical protein
MKRLNRLIMCAILSLMLSAIFPMASLALPTDTLAVDFDIKPQSCPNPFNTRSQGVLPAAVLGTMDFDVSMVDPASLLLEGVAPLRWDLEDVSRPVDPREHVCDCSEDTGDGFMDLTLKFDRQALVAALGTVADRDTLVMTLTGMTMDTTDIKGQDCVVILLRPHQLDKIGKGPDQMSPSAPSDGFTLGCTPNPFNMETNITFGLPQQAQVTLAIYNILGEKVRTLVSEERDAGIHTVRWDSTDDSGHLVASGIYFYRLETDRFAKTMKMILMK